MLGPSGGARSGVSRPSAVAARSPGGGIPEAAGEGPAARCGRSGHRLQAGAALPSPWDCYLLGGEDEGRAVKIRFRPTTGTGRAGPKRHAPTTGSCPSPMHRTWQTRQSAAGPSSPVRGFDAIDRTGLHLALGRIGRAHDVTEHQLARLVDLAGHHVPSAATVHAIPMTGSRGAVRYSLAPWTPVRRLHSHLDTSTRAAGLPGLHPTPTLRPHIGIAYSNRVQPAAAWGSTRARRARTVPTTSSPLALDRVSRPP